MSASMRQARSDGYERSDALAKPLVVFAVLLAVITFIALWASSFLERAFDEGVADRLEAHPLSDLQSGPEPPLLQATTGDDLVTHRLHEDAVLTTYGWIDRDAGVVRIPIEKAMQLVAERQGGPRSEGTSGD